MLIFKKILKKMGLLIFTLATSFCAYAQDEPEDDIDNLIDELFFNDQQFLDELIEGGLTYNFLYTSVSYNSNTFFSGRDSGTDQFNIVPQISYYHSSGFNASISGVYYQTFAPNWDFTSVSLGYFNTLGSKKNVVYNLGYTRYFYSDDFDDFTNSLDVSLGIRNHNRTLGTTLSASYLFGTDNSFQFVSSSFANITLQRKPNFALRFRPNLNLVIANQSYTFNNVIRTPQGPQLITITQDVFNLLNAQINIPISITSKSWDFELGYNINLPNAVANETDLKATGFLNLSIGYLFDLSK